MNGAAPVSLAVSRFRACVGCHWGNKPLGTLAYRAKPSSPRHPNVSVSPASPEVVTPTLGHGKIVMCNVRFGGVSPVE